MKISIISAGGFMDYENYENGILLGTEYQIFELSKKLVEWGHDVTILRKWHNTETACVDNVKIVSYKCANIKNSKLKLTISKLKLSLYAVEKIKTIGADILLIIDPYTSFFSYRLNVPKMLVTHTMTPYELLPVEQSSYVKKIILHINTKMQNRIYGMSDIIVALNSEIEDYLKEKGYETVMIPNGINIERYISNYSDGKFIIYGGRLVKEKGVNLLIDAYSMLKKELQAEYKLVIVGFGPEEHNLKKLVLKHGIKDRVDFVTWLPSQEFIKKVSDCSVFVLPSFRECMPVTVLEAMASGKTVVASDIPGIQDLIIHNENGFLFKKSSVTELTKYLELSLTSTELRQQIGENARKTIEEKYKFDEIAAIYLQTFKDIIIKTNNTQ